MRSGRVAQARDQDVGHRLVVMQGAVDRHSEMGCWDDDKQCYAMDPVHVSMCATSTIESCPAACTGRIGLLGGPRVTRI